MTGLVVGLVCGVALGAAYFGALWLAVRRIPTARSPAVLVLGSYLGRLALAVLGFYAVVRLGGGGSLLAALVGFLVVRHLLIQRVTRTPGVGGMQPS